jgi:membrane protease YdiL (CAAX protease family)
MNRKRIMLEIPLLFCALFLSGYISQGEGIRARLSDFSAVAVTYLLAAIPQILLTLYIVGIQDRDDLIHVGLVPVSARDLLRLIAGLFGVFLLYAPFAATALLLPDRAKETLAEAFRWSLDSPSQLPLALAFSLVSGYREELFFRGYLITRFEQLGFPSVFSVAATAVVFSLGHVYEGILAIAFTAAQGIFLALFFLRFRNLHVVSLVHGLYNFAVLGLSLLSVPGV